MKSIDELVRTQNVIVCVGSGGVGKTTLSAVLGIHAAKLGRKVLVMTIDPARRLANSLGLSALNNEFQQIDLSGITQDPKGELWATMLDMKRAFDDIVERYTENPEEQKALLENRFYNYFSTSLAGAQELSASEKLYHIYQTGKYDLIVLDTPPTTNALDFLDAPVRFFEAIDGAAFKWMINAGKNATRFGGILGVGKNFLIRTISRFTGKEFIEDLVEFLTHFSALFVGMKAHTQATQELFADDKTSFLIITSPDPTTIDEAVYFRTRLRDFNVSFGGIIVNRVRKAFDSRLQNAEVEDLANSLREIEGAKRYGPLLQQLARKLLLNAHEFDNLAAQDQVMISDLKKLIDNEVPVAQVPMYAIDVHNLQTLDEVRKDLISLSAESEPK